MQDGMVPSLRSDPRTSAAVRGSGWVGNSPQAEQLLTHLAPGERVESLFTTLRFHGALTGQRLLLWRGTFKVESMELCRPLTVLGSGSQSRFGEAVLLKGPEGVIELKPLSPVLARALIDAGRPGDDDGPGTPSYLAQGDSDASGIPRAHPGNPGRASTPPHEKDCTGSQERVFRARTIRTWQDAELAAVDHMRSIGFVEAQVTGSGADGGIDVIAHDAIAQVKHYGQPIGVGPIRELRGGGGGGGGGGGRAPSPAVLRIWRLYGQCPEVRGREGGRAVLPPGARPHHSSERGSISAVCSPGPDRRVEPDDAQPESSGFRARAVPELARDPARR
ncbi:restriction endonuclease [Streptomyces ambofaciens]